MATKAKQVKSKLTLKSESVLLEEIELGLFTENSLRTYGEEVNLNRSVPDYRDGLKPVQRRILWSMHTMPSNQLIKTARVIGDVLGKYHPHAQAGVVGAVATLVVSATTPIEGVGNWGSIIDPPGADRYTNVLFSEYGKTFFHKNYLAISPLVLNYDGKDKEPLLIPATLPNLLLNGAEGIGLGLNTRIPAFTPGSLLPVLSEIAAGHDLKLTAVAKRLVLYHQYGGQPVKSPENTKRLLQLLETPQASVLWESPFEVDRDKKQLTISNFAPEVNPIKLIEDKVKPMVEVASVHSGKGVSYIIQFRKDLNFIDMDKAIAKIKKFTSSTISYQIYVTSRKLSKHDPSKFETKFSNLPLMKLMQLWVRYRIDLEKRSLEHQKRQAEEHLVYLKLLILACDSLDVIFKALRQPDPKAYLMKAMKLEDSEAEIILNLRVKQLSKLDQDKLNADTKEVHAKIKSLIALLKNPAKVVSEFLSEHAEKFALEKHDCSTQHVLKK